MDAVDLHVAISTDRSMRIPSIRMAELQHAAGGTAYEYLFRLLDDLKYDGWIGCEYRPAHGTTAGLTWLYRLLDRRRAVVPSDD